MPAERNNSRVLFELTEIVVSLTISLSGVPELCSGKLESSLSSELQTELAARVKAASTADPKPEWVLLRLRIRIGELAAPPEVCSAVLGVAQKICRAELAS